MGLLDRLGLLVRADAHGLVDSLSDHRLLLRQHVREAREALAAKEARLEALEAEQKELGALLERLGHEAARLERDTDLSLAEDREDLARFTLEKLLGLRRRRERIDARRLHLDQETHDLEQLLGRQRLELSELEARARAFLERHGPPGDPFAAAGSSTCDDPWMADDPVSAEDVEIELLRRRTREADDDSRRQEPRS